MRRKNTGKLSQEEMQYKLKDWNPHWNSQTIEGFSYAQLKAIYLKERKKVIQSIYSQYGLTY